MSTDESSVVTPRCGTSSGSSYGGGMAGSGRPSPLARTNVFFGFGYTMFARLSSARELTEPPGGGGPCRRSTGFQGVIDTSRTADTSLAHGA